MFRSFFLNRRWWPWSIAGSILVIAATWYMVQLDVRINEWFGEFYDTIQKALSEPGAITLDEFHGQLMTFIGIAGPLIVIAVLLEFFTSHYVFRWRTAMNDYYTEHWAHVRHIEGASQRIQEDTMRFARIVEGLGVSLFRSLMTLAAFLPILWELSKAVKVLPFIGEVEHALLYVAILFSLGGTLLLALVGIKLPGLEFNNQKVEAAYRKELVYGEDHEDRAQPKRLGELYADVRHNYFRLYLHYMYFGVAKWSYLQFGAIVPYLALGPTIVSGALTLGVMQQTIRAFSRVENSFQYLVNNWTTIVELMSIYKRLKAFEQEIRKEQGLVRA